MVSADDAFASGSAVASPRDERARHPAASQSHGPAATVAVVEHVEPIPPATAFRQGWTPARKAAVFTSIFGGFNVIFWGSQAGVAETLFLLFLVATFLVGLVAVIVALTRKAVERRVQRLDPSGTAILTPGGYFLGPFDNREGLADAHTFGGPQGLARGAAEAYLVITHLEIRVLSGAAKYGELSCPFSSLRSVELFRGIRKHRAIQIPGSAWKVGRVVLTTVDGRTATLAGIATEPISHLLASLGAPVQRA